MLASPQDDDDDGAGVLARGGGGTRVMKREPPCLACPVYSGMRTVPCVCDIRVKHCMVIVVSCATFFEDHHDHVLAVA